MSNGKILIVDDSDNLRSVLRLNFEYLGYEVVTAHDGEDALRLLEAAEPDVVLLDVMMPRQNGFQVCRKIKTNPRFAGTPVIFLTAKRHAEDRHWGKDCGADAYLTKPFSSAELERLIQRFVEGTPPVRRPTAFDEEVASRRERDEKFWILTAKFDQKPLQVFRQKYGEFRFHEALEGIVRTVELIVKEESGESLSWMSGEDTVMAILPGDKERASSLKDRIVVQGDLLLKSFYDEEDGSRGYVVARDREGKEEVHVPLLTIESSLSAGHAP